MRQSLPQMCCGMPEDDLTEASRLTQTCNASGLCFRQAGRSCRFTTINLSAFYDRRSFQRPCPFPRTRFNHDSKQCINQPTAAPEVFGRGRRWVDGALIFQSFSTILPLGDVSANHCNVET
jgi:hypothetical protein